MNAPASAGAVNDSAPKRHAAGRAPKVLYTPRRAGVGSESSRGPMALDDGRAIQILATEHWSLLASRTLSWNESFSRASMLLATLSAAVVAMALVAQVAAFGQSFIVFALVVISFVEVLGLATFARLGEANGEDVLYIQGMNRIRHAYLEIAPHLEPYFVTSSHDDLSSVFAAYGIAPVAKYSITRRRLHYAFVTTQGMVGVLNSMLAAVFGALLAVLLGASTTITLGIGALMFALAFGAQMALGVSIYERLRDRRDVHFPSRLIDPDPRFADAASTVREPAGRIEVPSDRVEVGAGAQS